MNASFRMSQGECVLVVKLIWTKELIRFVYSGTRDMEKGGLTYTLTWTEYSSPRTTYSRSRWDLILY